MRSKNNVAGVSPSQEELTGVDEDDEKQQRHREQDNNVVPLKKSEVWAWYVQNATYCGYGWVASWILVPLLIQDLASKAGVEASNHALPCDTTVPNFQCVTSVFGNYIEPGTISLFISSMSSIMSFFASLSIAAVADHEGYRKSLLIVFSFIGCLITLLFFILQSPSLFWLGAILSPVAWTVYNICGVFTHSFLPIYGRVHPDVLAAQDRGESEAVVRQVEEQTVNDLSAYSSMFMGCGSIIVHGICIGISLGMNGSSLGLETGIAFTGLLWLGGMLVAAPWLDARAGSPMPKGANWVVYSWTKTYKTLVSFRKLPEIFKFMVAWFILSDGVNTIPAIIFVILYRELSFTHVESLIVSVLLSVTAVFGIYFFVVIRKYWKLNTKTMIISTLTSYAALLCYLVLVPYFTKELGLRQVGEGWFCIVYIGMIISTFYSSCRCMLSELCPEGNENEWFSLYLLADKGSSWMGPFITGGIYTMTGDYRKAFWFPLALIIVGAALLLRVDMDQGRLQAQQFAREKRERLGAVANCPY